MFYQEFANAMYCLSKSAPSNHVFINSNRDKLNQYLNMVMGDTPEDDLILKYYRDMNIYCDMHRVDLTDQELNFFFKAFQPGQYLWVSDLIAQENEVFRKSSAQYPKDSLDFVMRTERSDFLVEQLPVTLHIQRGLRQVHAGG